MTLDIHNLLRFFFSYNKDNANRFIVTIWLASVSHASWCQNGYLVYSIRVKYYTLFIINLKYL